MNKPQQTESWGMGYLAEGARGSTGPVGEERVRLNAIRPEVMKQLQESFANRALILVDAEIVETTL